MQKDAAKENSDVQNSKRENMDEGSVNWKTYWEYFKAGDSLCQVSFLIAAFLINQILISSTDYWLSIWFLPIYILFTNESDEMTH